MLRLLTLLALTAFTSGCLVGVSPLTLATLLKAKQPGAVVQQNQPAGTQTQPQPGQNQPAQTAPSGPTGPDPVLLQNLQGTWEWNGPLGGMILIFNGDGSVGGRQINNGTPVNGRYTLIGSMLTLTLNGQNPLSGNVSFSADRQQMFWKNDTLKRAPTR